MKSLPRRYLLITKGKTATFTIEIWLYLIKCSEFSSLITRHFGPPDYAPRGHTSENPKLRKRLQNNCLVFFKSVKFMMARDWGPVTD